MTEISKIIPTDAYEALLAATAPSTSNPFATVSQVATADERNLIDLGEYFFNGSYISGGNITPTGGVGFNISAGVGFAKNNLGELVKVTWGTLSSSAAQNGDNFIGIDYTGAVVQTALFGSADIIRLGYIRTASSNTVIVGFSNLKEKVIDGRYSITRWMRENIGVLIEEGCAVTLQANPNQLKVSRTAGILWSLYNSLPISVSTSFTKIYLDVAQEIFVDGTTLNTIDNDKWNNRTLSGAASLVAMTAGYFKKDMIITTPEGNMFYVYGTVEYATEAEANLAPVPLAPDSLNKSIARLLSVVVQKGATTVSNTFDIRPIFARLFQTGAATSPSTAVSHSDLINLNADNHTQYHNDTRGDLRYPLKNAAITGATKTKITYDAKGLVTAGADATQDDIGDGVTNRSYTNTEKTKLGGIATGATANDTDANLKARANHTGTQLASTISDFNSAALSAAPAETTTTIGTLLNGATNKVTPVDADVIGLRDSVGGLWNKLSWLNVKATLKTYFDTLYEVVIFTTKGDMAVRNATTRVRLPVGANNEIIVADSVNANGLAWKVAGSTPFNFSNKTIFAGIISPPQITVNTNDYNPAGLDICNVIRVNIDTNNRELTGIVAQESGRSIALVNTTTNTLKLKNENAGSIAANRFALDADYTVPPNRIAKIWYDITTLRWRVVGN